MHNNMFRHMYLPINSRYDVYLSPIAVVIYLEFHLLTATEFFMLMSKSFVILAIHLAKHCAIFLLLVK